jgi:hypothetical protein
VVTRSKQPFRLKRKLGHDDYPADVCAASRCNEPSVVVDDSHKVWPERVPLCEKHWTRRSEIEET